MQIWHRYLGGQFWVGGWYWGGSWASYFREVCGLHLSGDIWDRARAYEATMESACWWWPHRDFVLAVERPTVIHRELTDPARSRGWKSHRLHCDDGPAVVWPDGWGVYAIHGVRVPRQVVEAPATLTPRSRMSSACFWSYFFFKVFLPTCGLPLVANEGAPNQIDLAAWYYIVASCADV